MTEINETPLAGIGVRHDFVCAGGRHIGVITRYGGSRELIVYDRRDPDAARATVELSPDESHALAEVLGGTRLTEQVRTTVAEVAGLVIDWVSLPSSFSPRSIDATDLRARTGASIVALVRDDIPLPAPSPDEILRPADVVVLTGTAAGVALAVTALVT